MRPLSFCCFISLLACTAGTETDTDTGIDTDEETDTDTDPSDDVVWINRSVETSKTLNAVYTGGTGAWVFGDDGSAWMLNQGTAQSLETNVEDSLRGLWGQGDNGTESLTVVGFSGNVLEVNGDRSTSITDIGTANLNAVDGTSNDLIAVRTGRHLPVQGQLLEL